MWPLLASVAGGALSAAGALKGASMMSSAAQQGGQAQFLAALGAQNTINQGTKKATALLKPYSDAGAAAIQDLLKYLQGNNAQAAGIGGGGPNLMSTFQPTMEQLAQTPGYQWQLDQGLRSVQNGLAARGMGRSGNALAGAAQYAEGLAGTTFQQQLQNYMGQNLQAYNMLLEPSRLGGQAAGMGANAIISGAQANASTLLGMGQAANTSAYGQAAPYASAYNSIGNMFGTISKDSPYQAVATAQNPLGFLGGFNPLGYLSGSNAQFGGMINLPGAVSSGAAPNAFSIY